MPAQVGTHPSPSDTACCQGLLETLPYDVKQVLTTRGVSWMAIWAGEQTLYFLLVVSIIISSHSDTESICQHSDTADPDKLT